MKHSFSFPSMWRARNDFNSVSSYFPRWKDQQAYLLQLFSGEPLTLPSTAPEPGLKKFSLKNFKKCGRFLIRLLLTSFSFSFIWLSSSMFVAFDFDLNAVVGGVAALVNADELRQALCVPNNPIMSNSCEIESDRCRLWLSRFVCVASPYSPPPPHWEGL